MVPLAMFSRSAVQTAAQHRRPGFMTLPAAVRQAGQPITPNPSYGAATSAAQQFMQWYSTGGYGCGNWVQLSPSLKMTSVQNWYNSLNASPMSDQFAADVSAAIDLTCPAPATVTPSSIPGLAGPGAPAPTPSSGNGLLVGVLVVAGIAGAIWWFGKGRGSAVDKTEPSR
jgi:hypothetical protein